MNYEQFVKKVREHATVPMVEGMRQFGTEAECYGAAPIPRHALAEKYTDDRAMLDLWAFGMEQVLLEQVVRRPNHPYNTHYWLEFIGGFAEKVNFDFFAKGTDEAEIGSLEFKATIVYLVNWSDCYLLAAYGLQQLVVSLLPTDWPDVKVYLVDVHEADGWSGSFFFALRA